MTIIRSTSFLLFVLVILSGINRVYAQDEARQPIPRFEKIPIGKNGLAVYFPKSDSLTEFEPAFSEDSSIVYTGEVTIGDFNFGVIAVEFAEELTISESEKEDFLISYLDYLQESFGIMESAGYGKGHRLESIPSMIGVIDFWEDEAFYSWAIKGWINNDFLVVFLLNGPSEYPYHSAQEMFFEGLRIE